MKNGRREKITTKMERKIIIKGTEKNEDKNKKKRMLHSRSERLGIHYFFSCVGSSE
jgi:hypothetical protein